jgi:hypothetical protein
MSGPPIEVSIDELTVQGLDPRHGPAFVSALRTELADRLAGWRPDAAAARDLLDLGAVPVPRGAAPAHAGRAVAARIARALRDVGQPAGQVPR